jgi:hypothetical protein
MAINANAFKSAMGSPMGGGTPPPGGKPAGGLDLESLMGNPPGRAGEIGEMGDSEAEEGSESSLETALESAGFTATPEQINSIKEILGAGGGAIPGMGEDMGMGGEVPPPPASPVAKGPTSKIGKLFGK